MPHNVPLRQQSSPPQHRRRAGEAWLPGLVPPRHSSDRGGGRLFASGAGVPYTVRRLTRQPLASIRVLSIGWGWGHKRVVALDVPVDAAGAVVGGAAR